MPKLSTGVAFMDQLLQGGYDEDIVTTIYGPSGSGKTNLCLIAAVKVAETGKKVLFMDTEGGIGVERVKQVSKDYNSVLSKMIFFNPATFEEQKNFFEEIRNMANEQIGLIVIDSISMLYRLELGKNEDVYDVNAALGRQLAYLVEIARKKKIPILVTTQVYSDFDNRDQVKIVGGDLLKYGSKCLIELFRFSGCRGWMLKKHRSIGEGLEAKFRIVQEGIEEAK